MPTGRFLIHRLDRNVKDVAIDGDSLTIGRLPRNDLALFHRAVDETHAGIRWLDGKYWLFNLSSNDGVVLNGIVVERQELKDRDVLEAGPFLLRLTIDRGVLVVTVEFSAGRVSDESGTQTVVMMIPTGRFLIRRSDRNVNDVTIESDGLTIGRLPRNELVLNHRAVDETHAGIKQIAGQYWVFNLSSNNGVVLNRNLVERQEINEGDVLQAGPYLLRFTKDRDTLVITVEIGAGWQGDDSGPPTVVMKAASIDAVLAESQSLDVFWEKRKRESGKITDQTILSPRGKRRLGKALACWTPTLDLRQPWRSGWFIWAGAAVLLSALTALAAWHSAYSPGELATPHKIRTLTNNVVALHPVGGSCSACHSPFSSMNAQCQSCHRTPTFAQAISPAHMKAGLTCAACHRDHKGAEPGAGLLSDAVCLDCHTGSAPMKEPHRAGHVLGAPHPDTQGYPVINGAWKWAGLGPAIWKAKGLPESYALRPPSEQFHAIHRTLHIAAAGTGRMECNACHGPGTPRKEDRPLALLKSCQACHASTGAASASSAGCVSCHPPHGSTRETQTVLSSLHGDLQLLRTQVEVQRAAIIQTPPAPAPAPHFLIGALSLAGFVAILFVPAIVSFVALTRRSSDMRISLAAKEAAREARAKEEEKEAAKPETKTLKMARTGGPQYPHPVVDPLLCIGCHACVNACPHDVLAIVNGVATPVALDQCMEDTACMAECPTSPKACVVVHTLKKIPPRKVPKRNQKYVTDTPGIYLIGDVSGVPLVKNAINEGATVIQYVVEDLRAESPTPDGVYDVAIIGVGPAGFSAAACAAEQGLKYVALEQGRLTSTIRNYPAGKYIFFKPETVAPKGPVPLPGVGGLKEDLLRQWDELAKGLQVHEMERCSAIKPQAGIFEVTTQGEAGQGQNTYTARRIILAIGNLGSPMKLGVAGEEMKVPFGPDGKAVSKVKYNLSDPDDYVDRKCMIVGAGNSAIEAAVDLTGFKRDGDKFTFTRNNEVTLVVRSDFKGDLKLGNKMNIYDCMDAKKIKVYFRTTIKEISESEVVLADAKTNEEKARVGNHFIFALIGSERPTKFLQSLGVQIEGDSPRKPKA
jgi:thioredoxin reductase (NADPH)